MILFEILHFFSACLQTDTDLAERYYTVEWGRKVLEEEVQVDLE